VWLEVEGFHVLIKKWLEEAKVQGFASLARKLKYVEEALNKWNKEVLGDTKS